MKTVKKEMANETFMKQLKRKKYTFINSPRNVCFYCVLTSFITNEQSNEKCTIQSS